MSDPATVPEVGESYVDAEGRHLVVGEVVLGDYGGREVRGVIVDTFDKPAAAYTTTLAIWAGVWRDRAPRWKGST